MGTCDVLAAQSNTYIARPPKTLSKPRYIASAKACKVSICREGWLVDTPLAESPAEEAGVLTGQVILEISAPHESSQGSDCKSTL